MVDIIFRGDDASRWGNGKGSNLTATDYDINNWNLKTAVENLIDNPPAAVKPISITVTGFAATFNYDDGTAIGPVYLPVLEFHDRGDWAPDTVYEGLDIVSVAGVGLYKVGANHTSGSTFDPTATDSSGDLLYNLLIAYAPAQNVVYDMGYFYPGVLKDIPTSYDRIFEEPVVRKILLPVTPAANSYHRARMRTAASTSAQDFNLYQNETVIGTVHFNVGSQTGTVTINADTLFTANVDTLGLGRQAVDDAVAAGLSIVLAAQQVLG